jgi:hypothetical protein
LGGDVEMSNDKRTRAEMILLAIETVTERMPDDDKSRAREDGYRALVEQYKVFAIAHVFLAHSLLRLVGSRSVRSLVYPITPPLG